MEQDDFFTNRGQQRAGISKPKGLAHWVRDHSGGVIRTTKGANYALIIFVIVLVIIMIILFSSGGQDLPSKAEFFKTTPPAGYTP